MGWLICLLGAVFYSYEYFLRITPSAMEHALRAHFGLSATGFGFLSAFYYYAYVPMQVPVGVLMDRFGPKRLLTIACFICVIGTFIFSGTNSAKIATLGRFWVGFGSAFAFVGVLKLATLWLPEDKLAMVAGITAALGTIGATLGDHMLGGLVAKLGWQETVNATAFFGIGLVAILWFGVRDKKRDDHPGGTVSNFKRSMVDLWFIAKSRQIWVNGMFGCLVYLPTTVFGELWGIPYLTHAHGLSHSAAGDATGWMFLGFTIGAPLMGFISDKLKKRKLPMIFGAIGAAVVMFTILYMPGLTEKMLDQLMFLLGLLYSAQAIVFAVGREVSPKEAGGTAIAMTNMIVMIGAMFLQPLVGYLLDVSLRSRDAVIPIGETINKAQHLYTAVDYQFALSIVPVGITIAALLTFFIRETHAHAVAHPRS